MNQAAETIRRAIIELNGTATLSEIYTKCPQYSQSYIRKTIQSYSSDTQTYPKFEDTFFTVNGLGNGIWGVRNFIPQKPIESVTQEDQIENRIETPGRVLTTFNRIIRDTVLVNEIKKLVNFECQLCGLILPLSKEKFYIEGHHIKPLGEPYHGPDTQDNILIVCPTCHVKCDYKLIELNLNKIRNNKQSINPKYIDFHNQEYKVRIESI